MDYVAHFFAGMLLCNCLPHLLAGLQGMAFPSPFARPPGVGDSSPLVNFLWGSFNLMIAIALLSWRPIATVFSPGSATLAAGFLLMGVFLSLHFGKVRQGRRP